MKIIIKSQQDPFGTYIYNAVFNTSVAAKYFSTMSAVYNKRKPEHILWGVDNTGKVEKFVITNYSYAILDITEVYKVIDNNVNGNITYRYFKWVPKSGNNTIELYTTMAEALQAAHVNNYNATDNADCIKKQTPARDSNGRFVKKENLQQPTDEFNVTIKYNNSVYCIELTKKNSVYTIKYCSKDCIHPSVSEVCTVDKNCYDNAIEVLNGSGEFYAKFNSVVDICKEYQKECKYNNLESKTKEELIDIINSLR